MADTLANFKNSLKEITNNPKTHNYLSNYVHDKRNAKLGDSLVNFIYSVAKSIVSGIPTGAKVADSILAEAYKKSKWHKTQKLLLKGDKGKIADAIEALILYFWINQSIELEFFIDSLKNHLDINSFHHHKKERISAIESFHILLDDLFQIYSDL